MTSQGNLIPLPGNAPSRYQTTEAYCLGLGAESERELLSAILHEVRQPLVAIELFAMQGRILSQGRMADSEQIRALFDEITNGVVLATGVIGRMQRLSRGTPPIMEAIDLNETVTATLRLAGVVATGCDVALCADLGPGLQPLRADRTLLQHALLTLVLNGIDAARGRARAQVTVGTAWSNAGHVIRVTDNGPGIPADDLGRLFEPYFTTKPDGSGLGLPIARSIAEAHGGTLAAERRPRGAGAEFVLRIPGSRNPLPPGPVRAG